jgi:hypothetical protein
MIITEPFFNANTTWNGWTKMLLGLLLGGFWAALAVYCVWYFFLAKTLQPLTLDDLALMWRLHKQQAGCKALRIHSLLEKNNEVVGFKCECGFEFQQRRLITQRVASARFSRLKSAVKEAEKQ